MTPAIGPLTGFGLWVVLAEGVLAETFQVVGAVHRHVAELSAAAFWSLAWYFLGSDVVISLMLAIAVSAEAGGIRTYRLAIRSLLIPPVHKETIGSLGGYIPLELLVLLGRQQLPSVCAAYNVLVFDVGSYCVLCVAVKCDSIH